MATVTINDQDLKPLAGKTVVLTGGSSGIGLATTKLLLDLGASVVNGDINQCSFEHSKLSFHKTDVTQWADLTALFKHAKHLHGRIDHVFSNAGISGSADYLADELDDNGELREPSSRTYDINLIGMINTSYLGMHYMRHQEPPGGSVVVTASASSFQRFRVVDYATAKHGVLGFLRGMVAAIQVAGLPIRINGVAPSWTRTGLVPDAYLDAVGVKGQSADAVARSVALLMADISRQGQLIYSEEGEYTEIEEARLLSAGMEIVGEGGSDDDTIGKMFKLRDAALEGGRH